MKWNPQSNNIFKLFSFVTVCFITVFLLSGCKHVNRTLSMADAKTSYDIGDHERAFRLSELLAYDGDREAQYALGFMYFHGIGVHRDQELGILWIKKAAEKGHPPAVKAAKAIEIYQNVMPDEQPFKG